MNVSDIFAKLRAGLTTFAEAAQHIEQTVNAIFHASPPEVQAALSPITSELKQAASDAITFADTAAKSLVDEAAPIINAAAVKALTAYIGPVGAILSPAVHDGIDRVAAALKAEIDAAALAAKQAALGAK